MKYPDEIGNEDELESLLARPSEELVDLARSFHGSIGIIGSGGKMGYSTALRLKTAIERGGGDARVVAVSRFSARDATVPFDRAGIATVRADVTNAEDVRALPDFDRIVYMVGRKFGTGKRAADTWSTNVIAPYLVCRRYPGVPVVAMSTGNVYDFSPSGGEGSQEEEDLEPRGEYPNAAVGRERIFEWASEQYRTPICLIRLFYANDLRYGVLRDIADAVNEGRRIDQSMGRVNVIWQGDAIDHTLRAFAHVAVPPAVVNVTGPESHSIADLAHRIGDLLHRQPRLEGTPAENALLGNTDREIEWFGRPSVSTDLLVRWTAGWVARGGRSLGKPTRWDVRDGRY